MHHILSHAKVTDAMAYQPPKRVSENAHVKSFEEYKELYNKSVTDPDGFWADIAANNFYFKEKWTKVSEYNYDIRKGPISIKWFIGAKTNLCYNALDRHVESGKGDQIAYYFEGNDVGDEATITYKQLLEKVCKIANALRSYGVKKGNTVAIYLPMGFELVASVLACARIGAIHSVVFAGFSSQSLAKRMLDSGCKIIITADGVFRGPKPIPLKDAVDEAIQLCSADGLKVERCLVYQRVGGGKLSVKWNSDIDVWFKDSVDTQAAECEVEWMDAEDPLFMLYTSGSTGKPKGVIHTNAGYMVYAATTFKYIFDYHPGDVYFCTADIGWITGHSYVVYGPLLNCATSVLFEGIPTYPDAGRYWAIIEKYKVTQFYTAPTAIRSLHRYGDEIVKKYDRSSLRILGSVGEPINPEAWLWYHRVVGEERCAIVDTWWQTETGGIMITPLPGATPTKPGSATFPFFSVVPAILNKNGEELTRSSGKKQDDNNNDDDDDVGDESDGSINGYLVIKRPWPGQMRTVYGDHARFESTYFAQFPGYYTTGDGCKRDADGYYWLTGRIDDVMKVSGHLLSTAEIESALVSYPGVTEAAVVPVPHEVKGEGIYAFVTLAEGNEFSEELRVSLINHVAKTLGPITRPDKIHWAPALPKTRSGKIMRRILRKIAAGEEDQLGDTTTLADVTVIKQLVDLRNK